MRCDAQRRRPADGLAAIAPGTDCKAGSLVHALGRFTVLADTGDYACGQSATKDLATGNPARAAKNTDDHDYLAGNTPAQT